MTDGTPEPLGMWIGTEEFGGVPTPAKRESRPPEHWRLEAIAATERPRSLALAPDGRTLVFILDCDTSDLWTLDLEERSARRLTTGRDPMPYWEDTTPAISPDGSTVAYAEEGAVWVVPVAGGPPRKLVDAGSPVWIDDRRLLVSVERDDTSRLTVVDAADPGLAGLPSTTAIWTRSARNEMPSWRPTTRPSRTRSCRAAT